MIQLTDALKEALVDEERREYLIKAIAGAIRWYALCPDKRTEDTDHAVLLSDLIAELVAIENRSAL